jgi:hypothetical protein
VLDFTRANCHYSIYTYPSRGTDNTSLKSRAPLASIFGCQLVWDALYVSFAENRALYLLRPDRQTYLDVVRSYIDRQPEHNFFTIVVLWRQRLRCRIDMVNRLASETGQWDRWRWKSSSP